MRLNHDDILYDCGIFVTEMFVLGLTYASLSMDEWNEIVH